MDIRETDSEREVRLRYAAWLEAFLPDDYQERFLGYRNDWGFRRAHQEAAFESGWLVPQWERAFGGQSVSETDALAIRLEAARLRAPKVANLQGVGVVAPSLRTFGTPEQVDRFLVPLLRGHEWWALGMSEPEAGSDFGSLRTRALLSGDVYVINGQKIWTTQAEHSRYATVYCRTDPSAPKHRGITCFLVDLQSPGVTIRPIRPSHAGVDEFAEVFFDDVEVPVSMVLGDVHDGWNVAMSALARERHMIWILNWVELERGLEQARAVLQSRPQAHLLVDLGRRIADAEALRMCGYRAITEYVHGDDARVGLALKLLGSEALQATWELAINAAGGGAAADEQLLLEHAESLGATIYGGTSEVQRNIIAERALGLPRDR